MAMTYRENEIKFKAPSSLLSLSFTLTSHRISDGQDPEGRVKDGDVQSFTGDAGALMYECGRHNTEAVAEWFTARIRSHQTTFNHNPGVLNFALIGDLSLRVTVPGGSQTYTIAGAALAQGRTRSARNNWWFGGALCEFIGGNHVECEANSEAGYFASFTFRRGGVGNGVSMVEITAIDVPPYATVSLQPHYVGEDTSCTWQPSVCAGQCPPPVLYLHAAPRDTLKLNFKGTTVTNSDFIHFDTQNADRSHTGQAAIFIVDPDTSYIHASNQHKVCLFHHSSILGGKAVAFAGEIRATDGVLTYISSCSGHYRPPDALSTNMKEALKRQGWTGDFDSIYQPCSASLMTEFGLNYRPLGNKSLPLHGVGVKPGPVGGRSDL